MGKINTVQISGTSYSIEDSEATKVVNVTQAEYDALVTGGTVDPTVLYNVTDATPQDMSQYWTSAQTNSAITQAVNGKADSSAVTQEISAAVSGKQDTLVSGTNIKTINNESLLGSGNIDIQGGGGKAIEGGRGITVTTGATADTVSFNLPLSSSTLASDSIVGGYYANSSMAQYGFAFGDNAKCGNGGSACIALGRNVTANGSGAIALGSDNTAKGKSVAIGQKVNSNLEGEIALGIYNVSSTASTTFGDSGNTLFSVGNGTANNARHNAFEIRQNGDIYITSGETDIKLQDHLGGGGSITIDPSLDSGSTNAVANSAITEAVTVDNIYIINYDGETIPTISNSDKITKIYVSTNNGSSNYHFSGKMGNNSAYGSTQLTPGDENQFAKAYVLHMYLPNYPYTYVLEAKPNNWLWNINFSADASLIKNVKTFKGGEGGIVSDVLPNVVDALSTDIFNTKLAIPTVTSSVTSASTDAQVPSAKAVYDQFGGMKIVKLTESEYTALVTKDSNTLYVVTPDPSN